MIQDDEFEVLVTCPKRAQELGFKPQMEIVTNRLLPYAAELDEESRVFLDQVKTNLAKAVMLREMKPGCGVWSSRLMKYVRIYGLKFSKVDHIALIRLAYELVLVPDLEPCKIHKFATMFLMLTKKRHLVSPDELTLPWRPLYELGRKIFDKCTMYHYPTAVRSCPGTQTDGVVAMVRRLISGRGLDDAMHLLGMAGPGSDDLPQSLEGSYLSMVKSARPYFPVSATKEILDEFLPQICPWATDTQTMGHLSVFLPVSLNPKYAEQGHLLWFEELMTLWDTCSQYGSSDLMTIFAGLAKRNPGAIDWTPHVPKMFMRFLHALNLPVSYKDMQYSKNSSLCTKHMAAWIVWSMGPDGLVLRHLRSFLAGVESYLHSANQGRWSNKLRDLLRKLAREFLVRIRRERERRFKKSWENQPPDRLTLRDEDITEFVNVVLEPTLQSVYSRSGSLDTSSALHDLATLRPSIVIPPLVDKLQGSLTSLTEPHRVTAAMTAVAAVARPLLRGADAGYPAGPTHVVPLLLAVLPGLDANDIKKTLVSLHFILIFTWMVPIVDCSAAPEHYPDLTEEELLTCESTAQFEDFVLVFLDRLFSIIESSVLENVRLDTKESDLNRSKADAVMETAISSAATAVLMQCSPRIFAEALRKFKAFATESIFETRVSGSMVGVLLRVFARVEPRSTLAGLVPALCDQLAELLASDDALREQPAPRDLLYRLVLLLHAVECDGAELLRYMPQLLPVLDRALRLHDNYAVTRAATLLAHIFNSLSYIDLKDWRSSPRDYGTAPAQWLPVREWGRGCLVKEADFKWHVPSEAEARCAQELLDRYLKPEVARLRQWVAGERDMCRERVLRSFYIINAVLAGSTLLPVPREPPEPLVESLVPATDLPFTTGVSHSITLEGQNVRATLIALLRQVQARMLASRSDDTRGLDMLVQVWERVVALKGLRAGAGLEARMRSYGVLERALDGHGGAAREAAGPARLRMLLADVARLHDEARYDLACDAGITRSALHVLEALYELSISAYSSVRMQAQARLYWMLGHCPYSYRALVPRLAALLAAGGEGDEWHAKHKGALYVMLGPRSGPLIAKQDWEAARALWPALLRAPPSEKLSIIKLEQALGETLHRNFPAVNTRLVMPLAALAAARALLPVRLLEEPELVRLEEEGPAREQEVSARWEHSYTALVLELVGAAEAPGVLWRRLELAAQMLAACPSVQTRYPPRAVRFVLHALVHDNVAVRKTAQRLTHYALKQRKRPLLKRQVDPHELAGVPRGERRAPGYRPDLRWTMWEDGDLPPSQDEWDRPWLRDPTYGFYAWPNTITVAAPAHEQSYISDLDPEDMEEGERHIHEFFTDDANVERLVGFLTVEEKKGKDKFSGVRFAMLKTLFAQFGERAMERLVRAAERHAADAQEAGQRFGAEVAAALLRAPRYWPREPALRAQQAALRLVRAGLGAVTPDTMEDWGTCLATGMEKMDPRRGRLVVRGLLELCGPMRARGDAGPDADSSFAVCARLYVLQGALGALAWRGAPLAADLLRRLDDADFLHHPYQNVRETVGSMLMTLLGTELTFPGGERGPAPSLEDFLAGVQPRLAALYDENGDIVIKPASAMGAAQCGASPDKPEPCVEPPEGAPLLGRLGVAAAVGGLAPDARALHDAPRSESGSESPPPTAARGERLGKQLAVQLDSALRLAGDCSGAGAQEHARAVSLLTTVLRGCMGVLMCGAAERAAALYPLLPVACALAARGPPQPHDELPRAADGFLASLARHHHSADDFRAALGVLEELASGRSWWARLACLDFAQPLLFYGLPMLCAHGSLAQRGERFALRLMRDARVEVRGGAARLLTGLMHCRALPDEEATLRALRAASRSRDAVERHCGVLGLCAYLSSRPYSLGPRLGAVLAELARHTSAPDPVPATIRRALADFRRTHHDDWPRHRLQLTEHELDLLADLTSPPTYCA